ncbi:hypothetical protein KC19_VG103200 [Ceratodon purpureus]|uniref:Uncharacterized protein n=1 Tax=Ceratodon purpureus TaxID=3225 RepID=A0A8T0HPI1_CERPU|nr:hypothetical protein KC19_VG103200 [Ceratodon purpureus]
MPGSSKGSTRLLKNYMFAIVKIWTSLVMMSCPALEIYVMLTIADLTDPWIPTRGPLLSWIAMVFMRRGARDAGDPKPWLPDLPHLSSILLSSDTFVLADMCREEMRVLGVAANYTFLEYLENEHTPLRKCRSSVLDLIPVHHQVDSSSICASLATSSTAPASQSSRFTEAMACLNASVAEALEELALEDVILADLNGEISDDGSVGFVSMASAVSSFADMLVDVAIGRPVHGPEELSDLARAPNPQRAMFPRPPRD